MVNAVTQLRRGINLRFWITALASLGLIFSTYVQQILKMLQQSSQFDQGFHNILISRALSSDVLSSFLPVLATISFSAGYLEDVKSKASCFFLVRGSYSGYLIGHWLACWGCGSGAPLLGVASAWLLTTIVFAPLERVVEIPQELGVYVIEQLILLSLCGGLWAVLGMAMSTIMESKYIAYISPFIVYYLLVILYERYFPDAWLLYPKNWLNPEIWPYGVGSAAVFLLELTLFAGILFCFRGRRRLESL